MLEEIAVEWCEFWHVFEITSVVSLMVPNYLDIRVTSSFTFSEAFQDLGDGLPVTLVGLDALVDRWSALLEEGFTVSVGEELFYLF